MSGVPQVRHTVESLFAKKLCILRDIQKMQELEREIASDFEEIGWRSPYRVASSFHCYGKSRDEKAIDQAMWRYLVQLYHLERYMLCTDYAKMVKEIDESKTPDFTPENANGWLEGLQGLILENVKTLVHDVYDRIVNGVYYTGGTGYRADKKKRNNSGIDRHFILHTMDYNGVIHYSRDSPSIMDDLEKVCYLLDGKPLPEKTLRGTMRSSRTPEASNDYMTVKLCKNGNTHFTLTEATQEALNRYGPTGATLGEKIKIKVF